MSPVDSNPLSRKVFVHGPGPKKVKLIEVATDAQISGLIREAQAVGIEVDDDAVVMREDEDTPLDHGMTVEEAGLSNSSGIHIGRCRRVDLAARYIRETKKEAFSPAQRLQHVFTWAVSKRGFDIAEADAQDLVLVISGEQQPLNLDDHVGLFVPGQECKLALDLVPRDRIQGKA